MVSLKDIIKVNIIQADYNNPLHFSEVLNLVNLIGPEFVPPIHERTTNELFARYLFGEGEYVCKMWGCTPINPCVLLAYKNDKVVGVSSCFQFIPKVNGAFLSTTMVLKELRHRGIGHQLMLARLKKLMDLKVDKVTVKSWSTNVASIGNFKKVGFEVEKTILNERAPGVDGLIFTQYLRRL